MILDLPDIDILSRQHARDLLRHVSSKVEHLVSISDPKDGPPREVESHHGRKLVLVFDDYSDPASGIVLPSQNDVERVVEFSKGIRPGEYVLCHCNAGISRSSAAALAIIAARMNPSAENAMTAVAELVRIKNMVHPNKRMVSFADEILGYGGDLRRAHASTFQGGGLFWAP